MKHLKLVDGLKILTKEEWLSFRKYILMYCTKSSDNYKLLDFLYSIRHQLAEISGLEDIKKPSFEKMSVKSFSNLMSRVFNWYEDWILWSENNKDKISKDVQLVKIYNRRGAFKLADKTYNRVEKVLMNQDELDLSKHRALYQLHQNHYYSDNPVKYKRGHEILETLISYFTLQIKEQSLLYIAELHNWGVLQDHDFGKEVKVLNEFATLAADTKTSKVIELINGIVCEMDLQSFLELKEVISNGQLKQDSELQIIASLYYITFSLRMWNRNKITNPQLIFDAYDFGLESGILLSTGKIPYIRFINLVTTLSYIKTSSKTYEFVDKWIHLVDTENHESMSALAYAQLKFAEKKYDDIIPLLLGQKYEVEKIRMRASALELIGLYSDRIHNYSILSNRLNNYKRVLKTYSRKSSDLSYRSFLNFTKVLDLLVKRDFIKMTINLEDYAPIIYKKWLTEEIKAGQK